MPYRPSSTTAVVIVRMPVKLHQRAKDAAWRQRTSLNKLMIEAVTKYLRAQSTKTGPCRNDGAFRVSRRE